MIVDVVAPGSSASPQEIRDSFSILKKMNFQPRFFGSRKHSLFFAQDEDEAYKNFKKALWSKDSSLIWAVRGGYGSQRMIQRLSKLKRQPSYKKLFIGYSDVTVIHDWIYKNFSWPTLHFSNLASLPFLSPSSLKKFQTVLNQKPIEFSSLRRINKKSNVVEGVLTGGNLTMIQTCIGTPAFVSRANQILFLEDVNVKPYQVHRALWQMREGGVFKKTRAVVFGRWVEHSSTIQKEVLIPWAKNQPFPVFVNLPCGHGRINHPLPLGVRAQIKPAQKNLFTLKIQLQ